MRTNADDKQPRFFENMSGKLCLLRSCNELLRRLSRAEDSVLCGRIFIFMFQSFPLGDSSSVNKGGEFHVDNVTSFEEAFSNEAQDDMQVDQQDSSGSASMSTETLYPIFWTLQRGFSNPPSLFNEQHLATFKSGLEATLSKFKDVSVIQTSQSEQRRGVKRKSDRDEDHASNYNPKYLTSRDLFQLEVIPPPVKLDFCTLTVLLVDRPCFSKACPCPGTYSPGFPINLH